MNNFTLAQKKALELIVEAGHQVVTVAYDPTVNVGTPEADALAAGFSEYYRESTPHLIEVIYTK